MTEMDVPLSIRETLEGIGRIYKEKYGRDFPSTLAAAIISHADKAETSEDVASKLDKCIKRWKVEKKVGHVEVDVPAGILPFGYSAVLTDAKISARGPDDRIYRNNPEIRNMIPRGLTLIRLSGREERFDTILYANKKFTGGVGDEDVNQPDNDDTWREYCVAPPETAEKLICMEKLNGEAAHYSGRYIGGQFYIITGSKNVHMLIKDKSEIDLYEGSRYEYAKVVARAVCETLENLEPDVHHLICSLLHFTKCTVLSEILQPDNQHIVNLSALEKPQINVIMFTPTFLDEEESSLTVFSPHHALDMMAALGFTCTPYTIAPSDDISGRKEKVRNELHKEGEVVYYINKYDETIGIAKIKTCWYVVLRALREQAVNSFTGARRRQDWSLQNRITSAQKRMKALQSFLAFSDNYLEKWKKLSSIFLTWLNKEINSQRVNPTDIRPRFPIVWERFLSETGESDSFVS